MEFCGASLSAYLFKEDGSGICYYTYDNDSLRLAQGNIKFTTDFGETYISRLDSAHNFNFPTQTIDIGSESLIYLPRTDSNNTYTELYFNDENNFIYDSLRIDSVSYMKIAMSKDSVVYALCNYPVNHYKNDSIVCLDGKYTLMKSTAKGKQWVNLETLIPFDVIYHWFPKQQKYFGGKALGVFAFDSYLLFPYSYFDGKFSWDRLYRYNIDSRLFDSLSFDPKFIGSDNIFVYDSVLYAFSRQNSLYYNNNFNSNFSNMQSWDSLYINSLLYNWDSKIITGKEVNNSCFLVTSKPILQQFGGPI